MKTVIIGNHAAGLSAAETLRKESKSCGITMISREDVPPYSRCLIPYIVSNEKKVDDILVRPKNFYAKNSIKTLFGKEVRSISPKKKEVLLSDGKAVKFDALIIAAGSDPVYPAVPGIRQKGVFTLRTLSDANRIRNYSKNIQTAVVLGGGLVGIKAALALHPLGKKVKVMVSSPSILSQIIGGDEAAVIESYVRAMGIELLLNTSPAKILGQDKVEGVETDKGSKIDCELVVTGKGVAANLALLEGSGIVARSGILVDDGCRTNLSGIYAAGDITESKDSVRGAKWVNALWPQAIEEGKVAALSALGKKAGLRDRTSMNSIRFGDLCLTSCGLSGIRDNTEGTEKVLVAGPGPWDLKKFIFKGGRLIGYSLVGDVSNAGILTALVRKQADVGCVRDDLLAGRFDFAAVLPAMLQNRAKFTEPEFVTLFKELNGNPRSVACQK